MQSSGRHGLSSRRSVAATAADGVARTMEVVAIATDSPEEVLARLERYAAWVRASREPSPRHEVLTVVARGSAWVWPMLSATTVVFAFAYLNPVPAIVVVGSLCTGGVVAMTRRVPFSLAWTLGVVVGAVLVAAAQ